MSNEFSKRMKEARIKKGLSQAELSRISGISAATLSTYEQAETPKNPTIDKATAVAEALDVSLDWLCGLDSKQETSKELSVENVINAIMLLCKLDKSKMYIEKGLKAQIELVNKGICDFVSELDKVKDIIKNPTYPEYVRDGITSSLINEYTKKYVIEGGEMLPVEESPF